LGKALILLAVAVGVGLLVYWLAAPRNAVSGVAPHSKASVGPGGSTTVPGDTTPVPGSASDPAKPRDTSSGPIAPPLTAQEKERESLESRRAPLYRKLHQDLGDALKAVRPCDDDAATLDLYAAQDAPGNTIMLLNMALQTNVAYYGFRHIRFFAPNRPGAIELYRLDAEASADSSGNWQTFKK
jgi:hypothetical protein